MSGTVPTVTPVPNTPVPAGVPSQLPAGQPYYPIDMRHKFPNYICSSDNPMAVMENGKVVSTSTTQEYAAKYLGASWPCDMNAAQVVSVGLTLSCIVLFAGLVLSMAYGGLGQTNNVPGDQRMIDLCSLVRRGISAFSKKTFVYFGLYSILFFILILIVFSPMEYYDRSDGIRYAGNFLIPFAIALWLTSMSTMTSASTMVRTARASMDPSSGLSAGLRSAFCGASAGAWIVLGGILLLYTIMYLIMSSNRNLTGQFKYYLSCDANPAFCGQSIAAQTMVAFCCGVSCASFLYRSTAGIFAKASEIGSELVHKLEPDNVTCDKLKNPATIADKVGAALLDAGGGVLDVAETMCLCMVAAQVMAEGDSARLSLTFMYPGCALLASLLSYFAVRCSDQGAYVADRHISCCWGFRFGMYTTHVLVVIYTLIMTGAVYQRYPFDALRQGGGRSEGWPHWGAHLVGQFGSILLWEATSFFTSHRWFPTRSVTAAGITGPATMFVQGLGVAMISCFLPMTIIACVVLVSHASAGQFGVAIAAMGFWSPAAFVVAANAVAPAVFGADDCLDHPATQDHRQLTVPLVMTGESLSAEYRGWSVGTAMLSSFAVLCAFKQESGMATSGTGAPFMTQGPMQGFQMVDYRDVMPTGARGSIRALESEVILEGFVASWAMAGAFSTVFVAGISTLAIGKATRNLVDESRSQLHANREVSADPEAISGTVTFPAIAGTMLPAFYIILFPVCVGFFAGPRALGAFSVGAILAAGPFATVLFNSGASWAKSKTAIEAEGVFNGSGSDSHLASISTARAGGALKDVTAPCMCAYIKAISIWSLMMAPTIFISPYMPFVIDCAVKRKAYESILTCMDWNKVYWAILPCIMLLVVSGIIYFLFWNRDGTSAPAPPPPEPPKLVISTIPSPMVTNPVIYTPGPPPIEYATGPVMVTAQPPYQSAAIRMAGVVVSPPPEPVMAAPMRPHAGLDGLVQSGYIMESGSQYSYHP